VKYYQADLVSLVVWPFVFTASVFLSIGVGTTFAKADEQKAPEQLCRSLGYTDQTILWARCVSLNGGELERPPYAYKPDTGRDMVALATMTFLAPSNSTTFQPQKNQSLLQSERRAKEIEQALRAHRRDQADHALNLELIKHGLNLMTGHQSTNTRNNERPVTCFAQSNNVGGYIVNCQ
jgi:hypothetical protein